MTLRFGAAYPGLSCSYEEHYQLVDDDYRHPHYTGAGHQPAYTNRPLRVFVCVSGGELVLQRTTNKSQ